MYFLDEMMCKSSADWLILVMTGLFYFGIFWLACAGVVTPVQLNPIMTFV
jgi:uncharacterized membrane protein (Fun14 family)